MTTAAGRSEAEEEGQGTIGPTICAAGVPAAEMVCRVDPGMSVLEGSNVLANWATNIGSMVGGGGDDKAGEAEDIFSAIDGGSGGASGAIVSTRCRQQWQSPKPPPCPCLCCRHYDLM